ncbi:MAG: Ppx/GppA family phosphatase [Bacteroidales bacterium]|nr:Ppx/GppA family phosphatase [Bacteroidales bacterium]
MVLAAIDIGSNAARLLIANAHQEHGHILVEKATLVRIPTRLGKDVYESGIISEKRADNFVKTLKAFKLLIDVYEPVEFTACATAAMREAKNGREILARVKKEAGLKVRLIDGMEEARIIRTTHRIQMLNDEKLTAYIDVGGGSTEISIMKKDQLIKAKSFKIGTLRLLNGKVKSSTWKDIKNWLKEFSPHFGEIKVIGSGGNINKINKLYGNPEDYNLSLKNLKFAHQHLSQYTIEERIENMGLRPDRADVILPAAEIFLYILKYIQAAGILVPKIGLADGLIHIMYEEQMRKKKMISKG